MFFWMLLAVGDLSFMPENGGNVWNRSAQIDIVGFNWMEKTLILGECKWTLNEADRKVMAELVEEKAAKIIPEQGQWRVFFLGFSRSGWTHGAQAYQDEIIHRPVSGTNWISAGMRLVTLEKIDADLSDWSV